MQNKATQMHRVGAVAALLDVHVSTVYRAISFGALRALKVGNGKGALRIPADALETYLTACQQAAVTIDASDEVA